MGQLEHQPETAITTSKPNALIFEVGQQHASD
jgi:hypothetical protein